MENQTTLTVPILFGNLQVSCKGFDIECRVRPGRLSRSSNSRADYWNTI